jgi:hypothetical protein
LNGPQFHAHDHTGHSKAQVKASDPIPVLKLTPEEQNIMDGKKGDLLQKTMKIASNRIQAFDGLTTRKMINLINEGRVSSTLVRRPVKQFGDRYFNCV